MFQTAVSYQMYHALILVVASLMPVLGLPRKLLAVACGFWLVGILLFSGSLYLLAISGQRWLGAITPLGGTAWIAAWLLLAWAARGLAR